MTLLPILSAAGLADLASRRGIVNPNESAPAPGRGYLADLVESLPATDAASSRAAAYLDVLDRALEDRIITEEEGQALRTIATECGLSREEVLGAHLSYLDNLAATAWLDGVVTQAELEDLQSVGRLLGLDGAAVTAAIDRQERQPQSSAATHQLVGLSVCFTGQLTGRLRGDLITREQAEQIATEHGLVVKPRVTRKLDVLVVADPNSESGKARYARKLGTRIMAEQAFWAAIGAQVE